MKELFDMDNGFFRFMGKIADLIWLNFLFMIGCIPIITIGTSLSATYYVALKMARGQEPYITKNFFKAYKQNLLQTIGLDLIMGAILIVLYLDYYLIISPETSLGTGTLILTIAITVIYGMISLYIFPYIAQFKNTIPRTIQNCLFMSIRHFGQTFTLFIVSSIPFWAVVLLGFEYFTLFVVLMLMFGFAGIMFANSLLFVKVFDKYITEEENVAPEESIFRDETRIIEGNDIEQSTQINETEQETPSEDEETEMKSEEDTSKEE